MLPTRRQAAWSLFAAGGAAFAPVAFACAQPVEAVAEAPLPAEDGPGTQVDTGNDGFEHMLAPVSINDQGPFQFLIDTGANTSCVSRDLAQQLALPPGPPARVHTVVGVRERPCVLIERLQVGDRHRKRVSAPALPFTSMGVDGVLGVDWLKGQRLVLGFKAKSLEITRSRPDIPAEGRVVVPARRRLGQLTIVDADLNGRRISAMIDSGAQTTICNSALRDIVARSEAKRGETMAHPPVHMESLMGEAFQGEMLYLPFMRLGGMHLGNVPVVHADLHVFELWDLATTPAIVLGMDLLTQFSTVVLDFGRSQVRFDVAQTRALPT
jgi:predicted aspartyl protease